MAVVSGGERLLAPYQLEIRKLSMNMEPTQITRVKNIMRPKICDVSCAEWPFGEIPHEDRHKSYIKSIKIL